MKVMVIIKATERSEAGLMPDEKLLTEMGKFNAELSKAGILLSGEGVQPSKHGVRVRFSGTNRTVTDGPFPMASELVAGFWIWRVASMAEAIDWVKRCPNPMLTDSDIEIRPLFEAEDFGEPFKPELREQEAVLRAKVLGLNAPRFEQGKEMLIAGLKQSYRFASRSNIPFQWQRFVPHIGNIPGQVGQVAYGVCSSYTSVGNFDYLSGVEVTHDEGLHSEFTAIRIPPQRYAVFIHDEHVSAIPKTIDKIWKQWLPDSGVKAAAAPCIERYTEKFDSKTGTGGMEIWIPLET